MSTTTGIRVRGRKLKDIMDDLNALLAAEGIDDRLGASWDVDPAWPTNGPYWVACFPVNGRSEAFWVHIEFIYQHPRPADEQPPRPARQIIAMANADSDTSRPPIPI
jgi:hypothetical protein